MRNKFRKRPVVIEAIQFKGDNRREVLAFISPELVEGITTSEASSSRPLYIETLEGTMKASLGDWIIRGTAGELYPCKPNIFADTYEPVGDD